MDKCGENEQPAGKNVFIRARDSMENALKPVTKVLPHPNVISGPIRATSGAIDMVLHATVGPIAGTIGYAVTSALDWLDGLKARMDNLRTKEGTRLDSYTDKLINISHLLYLTRLYFQSVLFDIGVIVSISNDLYSMRQRGGIIEQTREAVRASLHSCSCTPLENGGPTDVEKRLTKVTANVEGKVKMILQCVAIGTMMFAGDNETVRMGASVGLLGAAGIGFIGTLKRQGIDILAKLRGLFSGKGS